MRKCRTLLAVARGSAAAALLLLAGLPLGASPPASQGSPGVRGSDLIGRPVRLSDGSVGAWVSEVLVDWGSGDIRALLLEVTNPGRGMRLVRLPTPAGLELREGHILVDMDASAISALPGHRASATTPSERLSATLRTELRDREGRDIGDIEEVIVKLDEARVANLAVRFDPAWVDIEGLAGLPLSSVRREGDGFVALFDPDHVRPAGSKAAQARAAAPPAIDPLARLSEVLSRSVIDAHGSAIGHVADALVDVDPRRLTGIVIALGERRVKARFPQPGLRFEAGKLVVADVQGLAPTAAPRNAASARRLLDMRIMDAAEETVGEVEDAVVNLRTGSVNFAVAKFDPDWVQRGLLVAVPLRSTRSAARGEPAMVFGLNELNRAYFFQSARWPDLQNPRVRATIEAHVGAF